MCQRACFRTNTKTTARRLKTFCGRGYMFIPPPAQSRRWVWNTTGCAQSEPRKRSTSAPGPSEPSRHSMMPRSHLGSCSTVEPAMSAYYTQQMLTTYATDFRVLHTSWLSATMQDILYRNVENGSVQEF